jgi:hypothetical protein
MKYKIWIEGYSVTGGAATARILGEGDGAYFEAAVLDFMSKNPKYLGAFEFSGLRNEAKYWGCRLFPDEESARASFG